jgi:integrase/recombinase XerD
LSRRFWVVAGFYRTCVIDGVLEHSCSALLGLRIFVATGTDLGDLSEEHGHRVLRVRGKGTNVVLVPLPPAA